MGQAAKAEDFFRGEFGITLEEIEERKEFLELSDGDVGVLRELHACLERVGARHQFTASFYEHILSFPPLRELIPDSAALDRLAGMQNRYFDRLTAGCYDADYVAERLKVGYAHHKVGLEPKWYIGAYRKYLSAFVPILKEAFHGNEEKFSAAHDALLKIVFFDMGLALDSYFQVDKKALYYMANHDSLTGLPNRNLLQDRLMHAMSASDRSGNPLAVLVLDLDNIKKINDSLGHMVGDLVILAVADRLGNCLRENDTVARWGGDEFVIVLYSDGQEISPVANKILQCIRQPLFLDGTEFFISASMGIAVYPLDGKDQNELLKNADAAMYLAKKEDGRNAFRYYRPEMNVEAMRRLRLEAGLRHALERNEFRLHYQPQIDTRSGDIIGLEALLRWESGEGMVSPDQIIPVAEDTGMIISIGEWVLKTACMQAVSLHRAGLGAMKVAVNFSARQFRQNDLAETVEKILEATGCKPEWLQIEITESMLMENPEQSSEVLARLANMGISLAIDDFGTGYSSLNYLKRFPIHFLKIDRSFVQDLASDPDDAAIVNAVISLGHSMKLKVVAEGVEDAVQLEFLRNNGCYLVQGYYFHRPVPAEEIMRILLPS